ncbi:MAG: riboflavin synthase [Candidatus Lokiarchaeota archaeon]|nr:riboflavin synthase [Candidatus Lokiarchaeota archaeon]
MFTGIIQETGKVLKIEKDKKASIFSIQTKKILKDKKIGDSIAVNGTCVTITKIDGKNFDFDAMPETLEKTNFGELKKNSEVNLEPSMRLHQSLDGHFVQGHVDTTADVESLKNIKNRIVLTVKFSPNISKYLAFKGSVTINGVSLTISDLQKDTFSVDLIPLTIEKTNLGKLKKGDKVNIEVDLVARYLERLLNNKEKESKYEFLKERNLI